MATRPSVDTSHCTFKARRVKAASTFTKYKAVKFNGGEVLDCAAGDSADGYAQMSAAPGTPGTFVPVNSPGQVEVLVGTGGATEGKYAVVVADGLADAPALGGGTTAVNIVGKFVDTGVAGDRVAMLPLSFVGFKA